MGDDAVGELLDIVLVGLDESKLDPKVGPIHAQELGAVDRRGVANGNHGHASRVDGCRDVLEAVRHGMCVPKDNLRDGERLVDEDVTLENLIRASFPVVVGRDVAEVVNKRSANEKDAVVDSSAEGSEERNVGNVVVAKVGLENIHHLQCMSCEICVSHSAADVLLGLVHRSRKGFRELWRTAWTLSYAICVQQVSG